MKKILPFILLFFLFQSSLSRADDFIQLFSQELESSFSKFKESVTSDLKEYYNFLFKPFSYDTTLLFADLDKDNDGMISYDELVNSNIENYSFYDKLVLWTLKKNHAHFYLVLESDQFNNEDLQNYLNSFSKNKLPFILELNIEMISDGLLPKGINSISHEHIYQGDVGDCGFISAVAALAYSRPNDIYNMLTQNKDGSFDVKFPGKDKINVTPTLETIYLGATSDHHGAWPLALELAFSVWRNTPSDSTLVTIDQDINSIPKKPLPINTNLDKEILEIESNFKKQLLGPSMEQSIKVLTGNPTFKLTTQKKSTEDIRELLQILHAKKRVIVAVLVSTEYKKSFTHLFDRPNLTHQLRKKKLAPELKEMADRHAYSVLDYISQSDTVLIREPTGSGEPKSSEAAGVLDGKKDGIFELTIAEFKELFDYIVFEVSHDELSLLNQSF